MYETINFQEATKIQNELAEKLVLNPLNGIKTIAGADISFNKDSPVMYAGIVILSYPGLILQSFSLATYETNFPYKAGYLGFKEVPALLKVWGLIPYKPDLVVLDGNGILHPRHMGVASHFGVLAQQPTMGCAKSLLYGENHTPENVKYRSTEIKKLDQILGYSLRTKVNCAPVYISAGHLITAEQSLDIIKNCIGNYRIPEPTRLAHQMVNEFRTGKHQAGFHEVPPLLTLF
ncbi:endonuclease V [Pedobacter sp.]|uniref:endonuclease V n=1 Tax=Pedobacter sp. TaxID=1411316 RepID=UPI003BAC1743